MFALHTPQTITLASPDPDYDGPPTTINFRTNGADTSRCVMEVITPDGDIYRLTFTTRGALVDQQFVAHDHPEHAVAHLTGQDFMVNGRDTRADNAYTYVAPVDADTAYRDGRTPGYRSPEPETDEQREAREKIYAKADKARLEQAHAAEERRREIQKQAGIHVPDGDLKTADDTTDRDVSWDAPGAHPDPHMPPEGYSAHLPPEGLVTDETWPKTGEERTDPMVPAPSTALPGGEPAHPQSAQSYAERSRVTTTRTLNNPPTGRQPAGIRPAEEPANG